MHSPGARWSVSAGGPAALITTVKEPTLETGQAIMTHPDIPLLSITGGEAVVIDPAWEGEELARHFSVRHPEARIMALVCTHGHADHTGGAAGLRRALGDNVPFVIAADDVETARDHVGWLRQACPLAHK